MKMIKCINKCKLIVIKSYSKYEGAFDANLNVIKQCNKSSWTKYHKVFTIQ